MKLVVVTRQQFMVARHSTGGQSWDVRRVAIAHGAPPMLYWSPDGPSSPISFVWECPGCGRVGSGDLGHEPCSQGDDPRWVNMGTREVPDLLPSLRCRHVQQGCCMSGHWWLSAGCLVSA